MSDFEIVADGATLAFPRQSLSRLLENRPDLQDVTKCAIQSQVTAGCFGAFVEAIQGGSDLAVDGENISDLVLLSDSISQSISSLVRFFGQ
jgi:hypothetical protein